MSVSPVFVLFSLLVSVFAASYAYRAALRFRAAAGVTPWRLPAWLWAFLFFCSWLIGLILFAIARATTRPRPIAGTLDLGSRSGGATTDASQSPRSADARAMGTSQPPPSTHPPAGWYPDPGFRHEQRYWDGKGWTSYVRDGGTQSHDPG